MSGVFGHRHHCRDRTKKRLSGGRVRYRAKIRLKGQKPLEMTFDRLADAREWAQDIEYKIKFGGVSSLQIREEHNRTCLRCSYAGSNEFRPWFFECQVVI